MGIVPVCVAFVLLQVATRLWLSAVDAQVPEPYLDEFFHVGQAQTYIAGAFLDWDPKITTPPGLYLISTAASWITGLSGVYGLRVLNASILPLLLPLIVDIDIAAWRDGSQRTISKAPLPSTASLWPTYAPLALHQLHTALNICLFPPLFFFSALYYTDIASTVSVILCYRHFIHVYREDRPSFFQDLSTVVLGALSLSFRQTNIFWVSIFPAALLLVSKLDMGLAPEEKPLDDPTVRASRIDDYFVSIASLISTVRNVVLRSLQGTFPIQKLLRLFVPFITILGLFAAFVIWNGGVVLGDKSNHVATLHLSQMLYIWPYMTFFSVPLTYPYLLQYGLGSLSFLPGLGSLSPSMAFGGQRIYPRLLILVAITGVAVLIVHYNTIVHPFTLADNRHYTFYVFRLLLRHRATRYIVTPIYAIAAWSVIQTLGAPSDSTKSAQSKDKDPVAQEVQSKENVTPSHSTPLRLNHASAGEGSTVAFVLVWLATSFLQLVTAPLVEPRYFILPWLMWRLQVPQVLPSPTSKQQQQQRNSKAAEGGMRRAAVWLGRLLWYEHDHRLWLETVWFLAINVVTGWVFLNKGFEWKQEPGVVQRFMW